MEAVASVAAAVFGGLASAFVRGSLGGVLGSVLGAIAGTAVTMGVSYLGRSLLSSSSSSSSLPSSAVLLSTTSTRVETSKSADTATASLLSSTTTQMVVQPITSHKVVYGQTRVGGTMVFLHSRSGPGQTVKNELHLVGVHAAHECEEIGNIFVGDDEVTVNADGSVATEPYAGHLTITRFLGTADQAADQGLISRAEGRWTAAHRLRGRAYTHAAMIYDADAFSGGIPNISAMVKGRKVWDPRSNTTYWSDNAALCILDYIRSSWGLCAPMEEIDVPSWISAANICDEMVTALNGQTERRYTCNGVVDVAATPQSNLEAMLACCAGRLTFAGGFWRLRTGAWDPPAISLSEAELRAPVTFRPKRSRRELVNTCRGAFVSPGHAWQTTDYPPVVVSPYREQDGQELALTLDLPLVTSHTQAQRIARIAVEQVRRQRAIDYPATLAGLRVRGGDTVAVSLARFGLDHVPFLVAGWQLAEDLGVQLTLTEDASGVYAHDPATLSELGTV